MLNRSDRRPRRKFSGSGVPPSWQRTALFWSTIAGTLAALIGAATGIIPVFRHGGSTPPPPGITVTSTNQTGGITAGIVNLGPPQRSLDDTIRAALRSHAPAGAKIWVCAVPDPEAQHFAAAIAAFLASAGYRVRGHVCTTISGNGQPTTGLDYMWGEDPERAATAPAANDTLNVRVLANPDGGAKP